MKTPGIRTAWGIMAKYEDIPTIKREIELIDSELEMLKKNQKYYDRQQLNRLIDLIERNRSGLLIKKSALVKELIGIKNDDSEVYALIYWHDIKRMSWAETYNRVYGDLGLYHACPDGVCKKKVARYLQKHGLV